MYPPLLNPRFMIVGVFPPSHENEKIIADFEEAENLIDTFGGKVYAVATQNTTRSDRSTFIGSGKTQEVADAVLAEKIDIVVINANIKPGQIYTLKKIFERGNQNIIVWDRIDLILQIFAKHAATAEAKLQIRMAHMRHMGPRIYGMGFEMSQQGGGIGTRGLGETNTELMKRHWRQELVIIRKQLHKIIQNKKQQMEHRKRSNLMTISLVGYTNSGKTSLFNTLCNKNNLVENVLFATLESSVGTFYLPHKKQQVYLTDTIGFIQNLPHTLIEAFKSTLMETVHADVLIHVIDITDPWIHDKITVVQNIIYDMIMEKKKIIFVFNKIDKAKGIDMDEIAKQYEKFNPQFISAKSGLRCNELIEKIEEIL